MSTWFNQAVGASDIVGTIDRAPARSDPRRGRAWARLAADPWRRIAAAAEDQPAKAATKARILVATRQSPTSQIAVDGVNPRRSPPQATRRRILEPISEVAEHSPELATVATKPPQRSGDQGIQRTRSRQTTRANSAPRSPRSPTATRSKPAAGEAIAGQNAGSRERCRTSRPRFTASKWANRPRAR